MAYKMKGFSGFKSPVKATDAGLVNAAKKMGRGLEDPTSLVGESVVGFLKGYAEAKKMKAKKALTDAIKGDNADDIKGDNKAKTLKPENKKDIDFRNASVSGDFSDPYDLSIMERSDVGTAGTLSPEEQKVFLEQYDPISNIEKSETNSPLEKSETKTRRNKKNRRRNRERP